MYCTYSNAEYYRHNEDIDPVSASAEFELEKRVDRMDVFPVEIEKGVYPHQIPQKTNKRNPVRNHVSSSLSFHFDFKYMFPYFSLLYGSTAFPRLMLILG